LGKDLAPQLSMDGSNFPSWSASLLDVVKRVTGMANYFEVDRLVVDSATAAGVLTLVQQSIDPVLRSSLNGLTAYGAYESLKGRFAATSWSLLLSRWSDIAQAPDASDSISSSYEALKRSWYDLEERLGGWTTDKLLSLSFHSSVKRYQQAMADSMDARIAIKPDQMVTSADLLHMATRLHQSATASGSVSAMSVSSQPSCGQQPNFSRGGRGRGSYRHSRGSGRQPNQSSRPQSVSNTPPPDNWASQYLTPDFPCNHCWEWGHWAPDCPRVKNNLPPLEDPRKTNPSWKPKKSNVLSGRLFSSGELASVTATPDNPDDLLCDTGATNHVTSHRSFFINLRPANVKLRVASQDRISVDGVGDAIIPTRYGNLLLRDVLLVPRICGTVISVGYFDRWDGTVGFVDGSFVFSQNKISFPTYIKNYRWFIPSLSSTVSLNTCDSSLSALTSSSLWHDRLGHIAVRFFNQTIATQCVSGIPMKKLSSPKSKCHSCSLAKSTHDPVKSPSREVVDEPGDLVGPFPAALDGSTYGLVIHDVFSRLTSVIGLKTRAEGGKAVTDWILEFNKRTSISVKAIRSDNAGEFTSIKFNKFLKDNNIRHELSIPYEHHQNGSVERTNRTLLDMARTFIIHAKLPNSLWFLAMKQACFIFNRVVHTGVDKSPYEIALKKRPSLDMVRVFGCRAYLHDINYKKQFIPRSTALIHVGISDESHGWLLWDPVSKKLEKGALVIFHEDDLPSQLTNSGGLNAILNSIRVESLGDFRQIQELELQDACLDSAVSVSPFSSDAPNTYQQAINSTLRAQWSAAIDAEVGMMIQLRVWEEVPESECRDILTCRWVFALKRSQEGDITKFKARIVAQGFKQIHGRNFDETFAPTPTFSSLRLLLAMASQNKWPIASFDVKSAFLHSDIDHDVYIWPPPGVSVEPGCVLKLRKALYGTRQAARCWWLHLKSRLETIGFVPNAEDQSTYVYCSGEDRAFLWIHVDDGLFTASSPQLLADLKTCLSTVLDLKWDERLSSIVGLRVRETPGGFLIDQPMLVEKIVNLQQSSICTRTPIATTDLESNFSDGSMDRDYLSRIGCLLYLAQGSRPDITFAVHFLARFSMKPDSSHWAALEHLISYIRYSKGLALPIVATDNFEDGVKTFVDANWGGEVSRSVHGFISTVWGAPVSWSSKRQTCVARSTCQAEYMALSFASKDACCLSSILRSFYSLPPPLILCDNKAAVQISSDCGTRKEHRHVDREFHTINELLYQKKVRLQWISTQHQLADILTKALGWRKVSEFLSLIGLRRQSNTMASKGGEVCAGCDEHAPPASVRLPPQPLLKDKD
jgi:hypothetical protein